jgi:hypothetical protein
MVSDHMSDFLEHLDPATASLLLVRQLVSAALEKYREAVRKGKAPVQRLPILEEARLSVGVQLALMAQRMGHMHTARRGILGFGAQQVGGICGFNELRGRV